MRIGALAVIGTMAVLASPSAGFGQSAPHNSPDEIVCKLSGSCGGPAADTSKQIPVGDEKAFSLAGTAGKPAAAAPTARPMTSPAPMHRVATRPRISRMPLPTSNGGLDMMINFANGSADLTEQGKVEARAFAQALGSPQLAGLHFTIDGHTNATGSRELNMDLSERRAESVKKYLISLGVDSSRLETHGYGFDQPRPGTSPKDPSNRRVEFGKTN